MATVGCSPHIDFLQISAVSAAAPWKRRTGKPIDLLITYLLNTYPILMYRDVYTSYYQWVPPFLIASACLFYLPRLDQPIIIIFFFIIIIIIIIIMIVIIIIVIIVIIFYYYCYYYYYLHIKEHLVES